MNDSGCSAADSPVGGVFPVEGLPPLPKGLSGILNSSGGSWRDIEKVHSKRARIQADITRGGGDAPHGHSKPGGLDAALALLRKEMVNLRQLDMSLLCQLWSLNEAIQEYKGSSFTADNGYSEDEEEEEEEEEEETGVLHLTCPCLHPPATPGTSGSKSSFIFPEKDAYAVFQPRNSLTFH